MSRTVPEPAIWGVGTVAGRPWPISSADLDADTESAITHLRTLGVDAGALVLIVSRLSETIHVAPIERAAGRVGARWSSADATEGDAFRTASLIRQLQPAAVIGVNAAVAGALADPAATFASVPAVAVTDGAAHEAIPDARWWLRLGPASAFECAAGAGAHYDPAHWALTAHEGEILVSNRTPRVTAAVDLPTGVRGAVDRRSCACGLAWPRVLPEGRQ